jgi:hypothetical protein
MGSRGTGFPVSSQWSLQFNPTQATLLGDVIGEISNVNYFPFLQQSSWIWHRAWEDGSWHLKLCHWNSSQIWNPCLPGRIFFFKSNFGIFLRNLSAFFLICHSTDGQQKEYVDAEWFASLHFQSFLKINKNINKVLI